MSKQEIQTTQNEAARKFLENVSKKDTDNEKQREAMAAFLKGVN